MKASLNYREILFFLIGLTGVISSRLVSFLLYHSMVEAFSIVIACATFLIVWNTREQISNSYLLFIGVALLPVAAIDFVHTLAYTGMGVFPDADANLPTQLWIIARVLQAGVMVTAPFLINRRLHTVKLLIFFFVLTTLLIAVVFQGYFPDCYVEGQGLTPFKVISEYAAAALFLISILLLIRTRDAFEPLVRLQLILSSGSMILAGISFTLYTGVYDFLNLAGHIFKVIAFWFIYKALVETTLKSPLRMLMHSTIQTEQALRRERDFTTAVFDAQGALIVVLAPDGKIIRVNRMFTRLSRLKPEDIQGKVFWELPVLARNDSDIRRAFEDVNKDKQPVSYDACLEVQGGLHLHRWTNTVITKADSSIEYVIATGVDITEQKAAEEQLRYISTHDPLTSLYNRTFFEAEMKRLENSRQFPISMIMIDMDQLKKTNDRFGHQAGDQVLKDLARNLKSVFRSEDIIARIGGDEFVALLPETDETAAADMVQRILNAHENRDVRDSSDVYSFSIGCATAQVGTALDDAFALADQGMYRQKNAD